ncbi:ribosomal-processing cysteine protease Prp [bacterium]|nr:ribosomal-processing cysteine protease Prp [bacterium]
MISVKTTKENGFYKKIAILGHAMYDDYGKDIVCSAASSIVTTTVNGILSIDKEALTYKVGKVGLTIDVLKQDKIVELLICNMISLLKELEENYKDNIEVK